MTENPPFPAYTEAMFRGDSLVEVAKQLLTNRVLSRLGRQTRLESLRTHLACLLPSLAIDCVFDVGANCGQYGRLLRRIGYGGRIVSFEPVSENVAQLRQMAVGDPRWEVVPLALGDEERVADLNVMRVSEFSTLLEPSVFGTQQFPTSTMIDHVEQVRVRRLESIYESYLPEGRASRVHLKLDTQGYDLHVLRGAGAFLSSVVSLQIELPLLHIYDGMPDFLDAVRELQGMEFSFTGLFPVTRDALRRVVELDCVMRRTVS